jgi:hypothetical protein
LAAILAEPRRSTLGVGVVRGGRTGVGGKWARGVCPAGAVGAASMLPFLETLGGRSGGFSGQAGNLAALATIRPSLLTVVTIGETVAVEGLAQAGIGLVGED